MREEHHTAKMRRSSQIVLALGLAAVAATAGILARYTVQIYREADVDEARPVDLIVVLGAAEYRGRPSPVLKARLDHGLDLYRRRLAPRILTTGGAGGDPDFTEGGVGRDYLVRNGVPAEAILVEPEGETTVQSVVAAAEIMRQRNLTSCIVVTDGYHVFRTKRLLEDQGIAAYGSPRPAPPAAGVDYWRLCFRQAVGYLLWNVGIKV